jgi:uncharacterized repeat protein (TIGR01451 family)
MLLVLTMGISSAATTGNTSKAVTHSISTEGMQLNSRDDSQTSNFKVENQFRSAGNDGYPNPGKIITSANYTKWVWTNIIITNNGPNDSNIKIKDQGTGFVFYNPKIGWNGWVRLNSGTGWKKDTNFDVKTGTGTYFIPTGSSYQIAILGYVNRTGTVRNDVTEIYQDTSGPGIYPSTYKTIDVPNAAIIRLKGEFRSSLNGASIGTATYKSWVYSVTCATNQGPNNTKAVFKIDTYGLSTNGTYAVSRDNGNTWNYNDNSFDLKSGLWNTTISSNGSWLLAVYYKITKPDSPKSTVSLLSQDTYNPYGPDNVRPKCLIVFDDGNEAQYSTAFKYMQALGITGTTYVNGYNIGTDGVLTIAELKEMAEAGWVIANHGYDHDDMTNLSNDDLEYEISNGIKFLTDIGLPDGALNLAYPGGYYNNDVISVLKKLGVLNGRSTNGELIYSLNGVDLYRLPAYTILNTTSVSTIRGYVDSAAQSGSTVILLFHNIAPESSDSYVYTDADFKAVMDYIHSTGIDCLNINQFYSQSTDVLINIPPFDLDSNTIMPGVDSTGILNATTILSVPTPLADIEIKINATNNSPGYGDRITYIIKVINNGPDTAENVTVGDWLNGDYFKYVSDDNNGTFNPNTTIWNVGDLENGEFKILNLIVEVVTSNTTIKNTATYNSGSTDDSNLNNNYEEIDLWVAPKTYININSANVYVGDSFKVTISLKDENNNPLINKTVHLTINGVNYMATTNSDGTAEIICSADKAGIYNMAVNFYKEPNLSSSSNSNLLTILKIPTNITVSDQTGYNGDKRVLTARLQDTRSNTYLANKSVVFLVNGTAVGTVITDVNGTAILPYTIMQKPGSYILTALFNSDDDYLISYMDTSLKVSKTPTSIKLKSTVGYLEDTVPLTATLWNLHNNVAVSNKTVKFYISNQFVGSAVTNKSGIATLNYSIKLNTFGNYKISCLVLEDGYILGTKTSANLTAKRILTTITSKTIINSQSASNIKTNSKLLTAKTGSKIKFQAQLKYSHKNRVLSGKDVKFFVNGKLMGVAKTNKSGIATFSYKAKKANSNQTFKVYFASDKKFVGSSTSKRIRITN